MHGLFEYADNDLCSIGYGSFQMMPDEIHRVKRSHNMRGNSYTVQHSPFEEVTDCTLEQSAGTVLNEKAMRKALTEATTGGHGYMKRCHDNMRSVLL